MYFLPKFQHIMAFNDIHYHSPAKITGLNLISALMFNHLYTLSFESEKSKVTALSIHTKIIECFITENRKQSICVRQLNFCLESCPS